MPKKTAEQLEAMLAEQIDYLESSSARYDQGHRHEAKRLAVTIRVLLHDYGRTSRSLLGQLGYKERWVFLDTAGPVNPHNLLSTSNLLAVQVIHEGNGVWRSSYEPNLADASPLWGREFEDWWNQIVVKDNAGEEFSRADLVLALANQEGGAHVDERTRGRIDALARSNTLGFMLGDPDGDAQPVDGDPILPCVRQIAYELTETIRCRQLIPSGGAESASP